MRLCFLPIQIYHLPREQCLESRPSLHAVFGGIGSIPGAMIGGILLGVIEILSRAYISTQQEMP